MLLEFLESLLSPCGQPWRRLGYLEEQIAICARERRNRAAWRPHLEASRAAVLEAAARCERRELVLLLGAGLGYDLPLAQLARAFRRVLLADVVHRPLERWREAGLGPGRVQRVVFDVTGVLEAFGRAVPPWPPEQLAQALAQAAPGLPAECGQEPDLVVSANLCSQLLLLPSAWAEKRGRCSAYDPEGALARLATQKHLAWLAQRRGVRLLLSDLERRQCSLEGGLLDGKIVQGFETLRPPDRTWNWRLAPAPEFAADRHLEHLVGAWLDVPGLTHDEGLTRPRP